MDTDWLIIVEKDESGRWIVNRDSEYILDDEGGYPVLELQVHTIRSLAPEAADDDSSIPISAK